LTANRKDWAHILTGADQISKVPTTDNRDINEIKKSVGDTLGSAMKNPVGDIGGETADDATNPLTGR
jgi:hypothetical protein